MRIERSICPLTRWMFATILVRRRLWSFLERLNLSQYWTLYRSQVSDFQRLIWKKAVRGDPIRAMIPPKMPRIAQSSLDPSVPERGRFGKGPAGAAALAAFMAFIALAFIAFIGKGAAGAAALAAFMAFIAMRDGPAPRVKRAAETEATPPMPMREKKHDGGTQSSRTGTSEPKWRRR